MDLLLLLLVVAVALFSCVTEARARGGWFFLNPVNSFWLAFVYAGAVQPALAREEWIAHYGASTFTLTLALFVALGVAFHFGYHSSFASQRARGVPRMPVPSSQKFFWCGVVLLGIGLLGYQLVASASGGWERYLSSPRTSINFDISGYIYTLPRVAQLGLIILLCHAWAQRGAHLYKAGVSVLALINLMFQVYSGTREGTIVSLIVILGAVYVAQRRNPPVVAGLAAVAVAFFFFGFIPTYRGEFRDMSLNIQETPEQVLTRSWGFYTGTDEYGEKAQEGPDLWSDFGMAISVVYFVPTRLAFDGPTMLLEMVTRPIPRALWADKRYPEGEAWDRFHRVSGISESLNPAGLLSGPSPTMVGKWYFIGGWPVLLLGGWLSGVLFRVLWECVRVHARYVTGAVIAVTTAGLGAMEMIHPLAWSVNFWLPTVGAPLLLMLYLVRETDPVAAARSAEIARIQPTHPALRVGDEAPLDPRGLPMPAPVPAPAGAFAGTSPTLKPQIQQHQAQSARQHPRSQNKKAISTAPAMPAVEANVSAAPSPPSPRHALFDVVHLDGNTGERNYASEERPRDLAETARQSSDASDRLVRRRPISNLQEEKRS